MYWKEVDVPYVCVRRSFVKKALKSLIFRVVTKDANTKGVVLQPYALHDLNLLLASYP